MTRIRSAAVLFGLVASAACIPFNGPGDLRRQVSASSGVELDRVMALTVGRTGMALARLVTDGDEIPLRGVRKVEVGIYEVKGLRAGLGARGAIGLPRLEGWQNVVHVREDDEEVHVLIREREGEIRGMVVVVAEDEEVVLVRVRGRLQHTIEQAMRLALDQADKPELFEPAVADYRDHEPGPTERTEADPPVSPGRTG